jgi:streptogramin lyase
MLEILEERQAPAVITEVGPTLSSNATLITTGPDGNLWFTENSANKIGELTTTGSLTEYTIPTTNSGPTGITAAPDGNLWFTENNVNQIGRITPAGSFAEFSTSITFGKPDGITAGEDGNVWFTDDNGNAIYQITPAGAISPYNISGGSSPVVGITTGPDGNLWYTESVTRIGRLHIHTSTDYSISGVATYITAGSDGNLWFTEGNANKIGRITTTGTVTEFGTGISLGHPFGITASPDGNVWFTINNGNIIGRITPAGIVTQFVGTSSTFGGITAGPDGNVWCTVNDGHIARVTVQPPVVEFGGLTASSDPAGITAGPDGNVWFSENTNLKVVRISPAGAVTEFGANANPDGITVGSDGNLWIAEAGLPGIARLSPSGAFTGFPVTGSPNLITAGPDGNLWFTQQNANEIGVMNTSGSVLHEYTVGSGPVGITLGPDGNLWFTENGANKIGRLTPSGAFSEPLTLAPGSGPSRITFGPDGNLWFTEGGTNKIGQMNTAGALLGEFTIPTASSGPVGITAGPDGNLWFTEIGGNQIGRITPSGEITEVSTGITSGSGPHSIAVGPDGNLWFTEFYGSRISRISLVTLKPAALPAATIDNSYYQIFTAEGGTNVGYTYSAEGPIPEGMKFYSTGLLTGTPTVSGMFPLLITVKDSLGNAGSRLYFFTVNPAITLSPGTLPVAALAVSYSQQLYAIGGSGSGYMFTETGALPPGLGLSSGLLSGMPNYPGTYNFTVLVTDSNGAIGSQAYLLTVDDFSTTTTVVAPASAFAGSPTSFTITVSGAGGTPAGIVTLFDNGTPLGSGTLNTAGQATVITSALTLGTHTNIYATYYGDPVDAASRSLPVTVTVSPPDFGDTFTGSPGSPLSASWQIPPVAQRFAWRRRTGLSGFVINNNNQAVSTGPDTFSAEQVVGQTFLNPTVQADVNVGTALAVGVMARVQSNGDAYVAWLTDTGQAQIALFSAETNTFTVLASANAGITAGTLQFVVNGSNLSLYQIVGGSPTLLVSVVNMALSAPGAVGIFAWGPGGTVDNFVVVGS